MIKQLAAIGLALGMMCGANSAPVSGQGTWQTTLQGRDLDGNPSTFEAFYDTTLKVTWITDWTISGRMNWYDAQSWAQNLRYFGVTGWRLPSVIPINGVAFDFSESNNGSTDFGHGQTGVGWGLASELGHMYYVTLGNLGSCVPDSSAPSSCIYQPGYGYSNTGPFSNLAADGYWADSAYLQNTNPLAAWSVWRFTEAGSQFVGATGYTLYAVAVHDGDVPVPATLALLGLGLVGIARERSSRSAAKGAAR